MNSSHLASIEADFAALLNEVKKTSGVKTTCFTLSTTRRKITQYYCTPIRTNNNFLICGAVVSNIEEALHFGSLADGNFDFVAVDAEKKIAPENFSLPEDDGNLKGEIKDLIKSSRFVSFKANDVTVNALDTFISSKIQEKKKPKIAIVGVGNIGFKIAQKLVERGNWVHLFRRDKKALRNIVETINLVKPIGTMARAFEAESIYSATSNADIIIATASNPAVISEKHVSYAKKDVLLVDAGKACFESAVAKNNLIYWTDVGYSLISQIEYIINSEKFYISKYGAKTKDGKRYVCGITGLSGDFVVRDIKDLSSVIGICRGDGSISPVQL